MVLDCCHFAHYIRYCICALYLVVFGLDGFNKASSPLRW